jgi:hypothetical protein
LVKSRSPKPIIEVQVLFPRFPLLILEFLLLIFMVREKEVHISLAPSVIFIRLVLPAGEAVSAPPLSATLGQVGIASNDFCKQFNSLSSASYETGALLNVHLFKNPDGTFYIRIRGLFSPFLFFQVADDNKFIGVEHLFDIFFYFFTESNSADLSGFPTARAFTDAKEFFGSLRSMNFKIIFLRFS